MGSLMGGLKDTGHVYRNRGAAFLYEEAVRRQEGTVMPGGALCVATGAHTGRSPKDKFIVKSPMTAHSIDWGAINQPVCTQDFQRLHDKMIEHFRGRQAFVLDCTAGADPACRLAVRVITRTAWHSLFAHNIFRHPSRQELRDFVPQFTIIHAPDVEADPARDGVHSNAFVLCDFEQKLILIGGTHYAGEIKKSIFGVMNYLLPEKGVMPMHCSANIGADSSVALFFGLSGTGKTTLSADDTRVLIGDDEHGWSQNGIFNFEGGCYAKTIGLSREAEPQIWNATHRWGTVLENVAFNPATRALDLDDASVTENTRACFPLDFLGNTSKTGLGGHPEHIVMLTADAFGVLPPISSLTPAQAAYHFLSGYTSKLGGTEQGLGTQPLATFSACFGAPFMPRPANVYGDLLRKGIARHKVKCWLVNTGWSGGRTGAGGARMPISVTRAVVRAALDGQLDGVETTTDEQFGLCVPNACPNVPSEMLHPRTAWPDSAAYDETAARLRGLYKDNFMKFDALVDADVKRAGIA